MRKINEFVDSKLYKPKVLLVVFIFTMMFSFEINGINMRYAMLAFWLIFSIAWSKKVILNQDVIFIPFAIILLLVYVVLISVVNCKINSFEYFRLLRCIVTYLIILMFLSSRKYSIDEVLSSLLLVLFFHAVAIILGVVYPPFKEMITFISQYDKELLRYRSSGFLAGFDDAGMLCNIGMIIDYMMRRNKGKGVGFNTIIFALGATLASRFNMVCMLFVLIVIMVLETKNNKIFSKLIVFGLSIIGIVFVGVFWVLTTNVNPTLKVVLLNRFPQLQVFYNALLSSYTDYGVYTKQITRHWHPAPISFGEIVFGQGIRIENTDIGYVKSVYSYGLIGILWVLGCYLFSLRKIKKYFKNGYIYIIYFFCILIMIIMESKTAIFLSSTSFEMLTVLYLSFIIDSKQHL